MTTNYTKANALVHAAGTYASDAYRMSGLKIDGRRGFDRILMGQKFETTVAAAAAMLLERAEELYGDLVVIPNDVFDSISAGWQEDQKTFDCADVAIARSQEYSRLLDLYRAGK